MAAHLELGHPTCRKQVPITSNDDGRICCTSGFTLWFRIDIFFLSIYRQQKLVQIPPQSLPLICQWSPENRRGRVGWRALPRTTGCGFVADNGQATRLSDFGTDPSQECTPSSPHRMRRLHPLGGRNPVSPGTSPTTTLDTS